MYKIWKVFASLSFRTGIIKTNHMINIFPVTWVSEKIFIYILAFSIQVLCNYAWKELQKCSVISALIIPNCLISNILNRISASSTPAFTSQEVISKLLDLQDKACLKVFFYIILLLSFWHYVANWAGWVTGRPVNSLGFFNIINNRP